MRVLVTRGAGFIGSHIVEHFQGAADVRVLDNLRSGYKHNLVGSKHEFIEAWYWIANTTMAFALAE